MEIDETLSFLLSGNSFSSVPMLMLLIWTSCRNFLLTISATSTALEIALPLAFMWTSFWPLLNCVMVAST